VTIEDLVRLRRARDQMDRDYARPLDVSALARTALMSGGHFSRSFREAFGETPYSYLMTRRIERAKALLRRGDMSVTDVCFEVGCTSLGSFSKGMLRGVVFATADCDATFDRIREAGGDVVWEPIDQPYGVRDCAFRDPAGNLLRFSQSPGR
jgi:AraC-like DNA-binding protein